MYIGDDDLLQQVNLMFLLLWCTYTGLCAYLYNHAVYFRRYFVKFRIVWLFLNLLICDNGNSYIWTHSYKTYICSNEYLHENNSLYYTTKRYKIIVLFYFFLQIERMDKLSEIRLTFGAYQYLVWFMYSVLPVNST